MRIVKFILYINQNKSISMNRFWGRFVVLTLLTAVSMCSSAQARLSAQEVQRLRSEFVAATYEDFAQSVVFVTGDFVDPAKKSLSEFFVENTESQYGIATGFFISSDGYILTSAHAVSKTTNHIIETFDGKSYDAVLISTLIPCDLALLKINPETPVKPVLFKESSTIRCGEIVMSIAHPRDMRFSCIQGIISGSGRQVHLLDFGITLKNVLQTDMALYGGSSGGPWFDLDQEVVGITTSQQFDSQCISYGISHTEILNNLLTLYDFPRRNNFNRGFALKPNNGRCLVSNVEKKSPAAIAGLQENDVIESVNGTAVAGITSWIIQESKFSPETPVEITVLRGDQNEKVTLRFAFDKFNMPEINDVLWAKVGIRVRAMTPEEISQFELKSPFAYLITDVDAARFEELDYHPQANDVLGKIAHIRPRDLTQLNRILDNLPAQSRISMVILRVIDKQTHLSVLNANDQSDSLQQSPPVDVSTTSEQSDTQNVHARNILKTRIDIDNFEIK